MKNISLVVLVSALLIPGLAAAQGYYGPPQPERRGGFHPRAGRLIYGGSIGFGGMSDSGGQIVCSGCNYSPAAVMVEGHLGGMVSDQLGIMLEIQGNAQTISSDAYGDTTLTQAAVMGAVQLWVLPMVWIKGGLGFARLNVDDTYYGTSTPVDNGFAVMAGAGIELFATRRFAFNLQARGIAASYHGAYSDSITSGTIGVGIDWF